MPHSIKLHRDTEKRLERTSSKDGERIVTTVRYLCALA